MPTYVKVFDDAGTYWFLCPGCKTMHPVTLRDERNGRGWTFNGDLAAPTFSPSLMVYPTDRNGRCHSFIRGGKIEFLVDCQHEFAGQTVSMVDLETTDVKPWD